MLLVVGSWYVSLQYVVSSSCIIRHKFSTQEEGVKTMTSDDPH